MPVAQVIDLLGAFVQLAQRQQVGPAQVVDVDVVADAGPVGRLVVGSVDLDVGALAHRRLDGQRNQVRLRAMILAAKTVVARAAGVEIPQGRIVQPARAALVVAHPLHGPLALPVGVDRGLGHLFRDGNGPGHAVDGRRAAEDELAHAGRLHRRQQVLRVRRVVPVVLQRLTNRLAHLNPRGEMHHRLDTPLLQGLNEQIVVGQVADDHLHVSDGGTMALAEIVENDRLMALAGQQGGHVAADIAGAAANKYPHVVSSFSGRPICCAIFLNISAASFGSSPRSIQLMSPFCVGSGSIRWVVRVLCEWIR